MKMLLLCHLSTQAVEVCVCLVVFVAFVPCFFFSFLCVLLFICWGACFFVVVVVFHSVWFVAFYWLGSTVCCKRFADTSCAVPGIGKRGCALFGGLRCGKFLLDNVEQESNTGDDPLAGRGLRLQEEANNVPVSSLLGFVKWAFVLVTAVNLIQWE